MATITLTEEQLRLVQSALEFYSRVGIGQFEVIKEHPTFEKVLRKEFKDKEGNVDYGRYHEVREKEVITDAYEVGRLDNSMYDNYEDYYEQTFNRKEK